MDNFWRSRRPELGMSLTGSAIGLIGMAFGKDVAVIVGLVLLILGLGFGFRLKFHLPITRPLVLLEYSAYPQEELFVEGANDTPAFNATVREISVGGWKASFGLVPQVLRGRKYPIPINISYQEGEITGVDKLRYFFQQQAIIPLTVEYEDIKQNRFQSIYELRAAQNNQYFPLFKGIQRL
jgi:hypothetical protein